MKKKILVFILILVFIVSVSVISFANTTVIETTTITTRTVTAQPKKVEKPFLTVSGGMGLGYYYLYPKDDQVKNFYRGGVDWKMFMEFKAASGFSLAGELGVITGPNKSSLAPPNTSLTIVPMTVSLKYHILDDTAISPFVGGGVGIYAISEKDPDFTYLQTTQFGQHIFAGADIKFAPGTILRGEVRQTFINPVSNSLYYNAGFGGISAMVSLGIEIPLNGDDSSMTPEERELARQEKLYNNMVRDRQTQLREMEEYYRQKQWNENIYRRWKSREVLYKDMELIKKQIEEEKAKAEELKKERAEKRKKYLEEKQRLREEAKKKALEGK